MTSVAETMPDDQGGGGGFLARLKAQAIEYSQISTMHGLRYIGEVERPTFERLASSSNWAHLLRYAHETIYTFLNLTYIMIKLHYKMMIQ